MPEQQTANAVAHQVPIEALGPQTPNTVVHQEPKRMTDQQIAFAVDYTFLNDAALYNSRIDAAVNLGIVTLTGWADDLMALERAAKLAQTIRGVRGVVNTLVLKAPSRPDRDIRKDVESALLYDAATDSYELKPEVKAGIVTLSGEVPSFREKQLVVYVAKGVKGVKAVKDIITLKSTSKRPDTEIATEVKRALAIDVWLHPIFINTEVNDGVVMLTGSVGSPAQHDRATLLAWTAGVKSVNAEGLKIEPWAKAGGQRQETVAIKDDAQIQQAVKDALLHDPRVFSFSPGVDAENGVVTLTGVVDNLKARRAAEQDAMNTWGVSRVRNLLKTRPVKLIADTKLAQNVVLAFSRDPVVDSRDINLKAKKGVVALNGSVDSYYERALAEDITSRANGVVDVRNNLTVNDPSLLFHDLGYDPYWAYLPSQPYLHAVHAPLHSTWRYSEDAVVKEDVTDKLLSSPWLSVDHVTVNVVNGVVTLTGYVGSQFELNKATQYAYEGGAQQVNNNIAIR